MTDSRGNLTFVEGGRHIPFRIARAFWLYEVPGGQMRGGHAYRQLEEVFIVLSGSVSVTVDDGTAKRRTFLNRSYVGLYVPAMIWRQLEDFSTNAVCLILASRRFEPEDYVYDYDEFLRLTGSHT